MGRRIGAARGQVWACGDDCLRTGRKVHLSTVLIWVVIGGYALVVAGWWARHVLISLTRPLDLYVSPADPERSSFRVSVIVAARNESQRISGCIETLLNQGPVVHEVIVVDDRSDDGTADSVRNAARGDARVRVVRVDALPAGWAGKAHACQRGGEVAEADWLLFADADCRFRPGGVAGAVEYAERRGADLLTLWLAADHRSFWEHMLIPLCGALILYWFPPLRANRRGSRLSYANGQFILMRRSAYREIGGHTTCASGKPHPAVLCPGPGGDCSGRGVVAVDRRAEPSQRARTCRSGECARVVWLSCSGGPRVPVMQAADHWNRDDTAATGRLDFAWHRSIPVKREMRS